MLFCNPDFGKRLQNKKKSWFILLYKESTKGKTIFYQNYHGCLGSTIETHESMKIGDFSIEVNNNKIYTNLVYYQLLLR